MKNLEPKGLWSSFYSLTQIPRPSGKRKEIADFLVNYGKSLGLETLQDEIGNVLIRKPASPGYENHPHEIIKNIIKYNINVIIINIKIFIGKTS